jgi:hypothetical protein
MKNAKPPQKASLQPQQQQHKETRRGALEGDVGHHKHEDGKAAPKDQSEGAAAATATRNTAGCCQLQA